MTTEGLVAIEEDEITWIFVAFDEKILPTHHPTPSTPDTLIP